MPEIAGIEFTVRSLTENEKALVFDQNLVLTRTTRENLEKILYPILSGRNVLLVGDAGIGKNALVYYLNKIRNIPTIRFSFNQDTLPEDLVGSFRVLPGGFHWQNGPLSEAMEKGYCFVADEMNLASPEILRRFTSVLEKRKLALLEKDGEEIEAHEGFCFIATQNPVRGFEGRKSLPESITRYFTLIHLDNYNAEEETEIMSGIYPTVHPEIIAKIVHLQRKLEQAIWSNELAKDELEHYHFNIRSGMRFWSRLHSQEYTPENESGFRDAVFQFYVNIFRSEPDRETALKIAGEVLQVSFAELMSDYKISESQAMHIIKTGSLPDVYNSAKGQLDPLPMTSERLLTADRIMQSLLANENLLLEADDSVRLNELITALAAHNNQDLVSIFLNRGMHTSDIIGALRPVRNEQVQVRWIDGPLTSALRAGKWILLDNIEAAGSELIEKMNMLLDHAGQLSLPPEAEGGGIVKKEGNCRIIAIKRYRKSRNQPTISRAFRNRFFSLHARPVFTGQEIAQSASLYWEHFFSEESLKISRPLVDKLVLFHMKMAEAAETKKIGEKSADAIHFREENLLRLFDHIRIWSGRKIPAEQTIRKAAMIHYISSLGDSKDKEWGFSLLDRILTDLPLDEIFKSITAGKKKILNKSSSFKPQIPTWDQKKHFRTAHTGKARPRLSGNPLKKGLRINTPETGGNTKEGEDAWYGKDTQGNKGQGEPAGGGGAWGYRTDELFEQFLKKYKPKWEYHMGYTLGDFYDIFSKMLESLQVELENALESDTAIERKLSASGHRIDARRYIGYQANAGNDHIFDRSRIMHTEDKLKGLEFIFLIAKGRRLFNFQASVASVVALQCSMEILWDRRVPLRTFGYSDFDNHKQSIDIVEYVPFLQEPPTPEMRSEIFTHLVDNWNGDTVEETQVLRQAVTQFSPESTTRIVVMVSDFRGHRARAEMRDEITSRENRELRELVKAYADQNIHFFALQTGTRYLAEHLFAHSLWLNEENFDTAPIVLAEQLKDMILKYHKVQV